MMRGLLYVGRHHVRTAPRLEGGELVTVSTVAARLRREARLRAFLGQLVGVDECAEHYQRQFGIGA